jgi:hypothetical protein
MGLKFIGTHQRVAFADVMNLLGNDIDAIKKKNKEL